jgi:hypothetical protein
MAKRNPPFRRWQIGGLRCANPRYALNGFFGRERPRGPNIGSGY